MNNKMQIQFDGYSCNETFARNVVALFALPLSPTLMQLSDIKTVVSEAVTNCIVHAYPGKVGQIYITCTVEDDVLHIEVRDEGEGIKDVEQALQPFFTTSPSEERSGMGFTIMQTFMDEFKVISSLGKGTTVYMSKRLGESMEQAQNMVEQEEIEEEMQYNVAEEKEEDKGKKQGEEG